MKNFLSLKLKYFLKQDIILQQLLKNRDFNYKVSLFFYTKFIKKGENAMKNTAISATKKNTHNITFPKK